LWTGVSGDSCDIKALRIIAFTTVAVRVPTRTAFYSE
jgi:hypothetical protein